MESKMDFKVMLKAPRCVCTYQTERVYISQMSNARTLRIDYKFLFLRMPMLCNFRDICVHVYSSLKLHPS